MTPKTIASITARLPARSAHPSAQELDAALLRRGMKRSTTRRAILEAFVACGEHVSADELTARVRERVPRLSPSTVYRTLNALVAAGLASARAFGDGQTRFEPAGGDHHDHLVCRRCREVVEFRNDEIERLQDEVADRLGFEITSHRLELYGTCQACRASAAR
jgi:Fur family ferric uptake transcriptional regulator